MRIRNLFAFVLAALLTLNMAAPVATTAHAATTASQTKVTTKTLGKGTKWETTMYIIKGSKAGPTVWISGGIHGNEPAGFKAANQVKNWNIDKGTVILLPEANKVGIKAGKRNSSYGDLNRDFPRKKGESADNALAKAIWKEYLNYKPDYLLDLHEGYNYHVQTKSSVGQSIIYYPRGNMKTFATKLVTKLNKTTPYSKRFSKLTYPVSGSLARAAGIYGTPAAIFETCTKDPLNTRIKNQLTAVEMFINNAGIKVTSKS